MKIITRLLILSFGSTMDPEILYGNDVLVSILHLLEASYLWAIREYCHFFLFSVSVVFTFLSEATPSPATEKRNPIEIRYDYLARARFWLDSTDRRVVLCIGRRDFPFFLDRISERLEEFLPSFNDSSCFRLALYFSLPIRENFSPVIFNFSGLYNQVARSSCTFYNVLQNRNIGIAFCSMFFPRGLPGNRYSN